MVAEQWSWFDNPGELQDKQIHRSNDDAFPGIIFFNIKNFPAWNPKSDPKKVHQRRQEKTEPTPTWRETKF